MIKNNELFSCYFIRHRRFLISYASKILWYKTGSTSKGIINITQPWDLSSYIDEYYFSNNALNQEARTFDETSQKSSQTNIQENYANTRSLTTPKYNGRKVTKYTHQLDSRKDETKNHSKLNSLNLPSISYSSTWHLPEGSSNSKTSSQEDQYISNLIRDSKNYKFGKISL